MTEPTLPPLPRPRPFAVAGCIATALLFAVGAWVSFSDGAQIVGWVMVAGSALYGLVWLPIEVRAHRNFVEVWRAAERIRLWVEDAS